MRDKTKYAFCETKLTLFSMHTVYSTAVHLVVSRNTAIMLIIKYLPCDVYNLVNELKM